MLGKKIEQGLACYRDGNYSQALYLLMPFAQLPDNASVLYVIAQSFRRVGELSKSEFFFKKLISTYSHPAFYCAYAGLLNDIGKVDCAISCFDKALDIDSKYFDAHYNKALVLLNNNRFEDAILSFNFSRLISCEHSGATIGLGQSYVATGKVAEAIALYEIYLNKEENTLIMYQLGKLHLSMDAYDKAAHFLKLCADSYPENRIFNLAYIDCLQLHFCTEIALQYTRKLLKTYPLDTDVHDRFFNILWDINSKDVFVEYQIAYKNSPLDILTLDYVHKLIKTDNLIIANDILEYYTSHMFDDRAFVMFAHVLREIGQFERSLIVLDKLDLDKLNIDAMYERVITLLCLKNYSQALACAGLMYSQAKPTQGSIALYATVLRMSNRLQEYSDIFNYKDYIGVFDLLSKFTPDAHVQLAIDISNLHSDKNTQ